MSPNRILKALDAARPLPGDSSRDGMLPENRRGAVPDTDHGSWRDAAVLVLLYPIDGTVRFPLMLRPEGTGPHSSQVSLPGGAREAGESFEDCALRETKEELGVPAEDMEILRGLTMLCVPPSRFVVRPFVGMCGAKPQFKPASAEVVALIDVDVDELIDSASRYEDSVVLDGLSWRIPCYRLSGWRVWGATAMILAELRILLLGA